MESLNFFFFGYIHCERFVVALFLTCTSNANGIKISLSGKKKKKKKDEPQLAHELLLKCEKHLVDKHVVMVTPHGNQFLRTCRSWALISTAATEDEEEEKPVGLENIDVTVVLFFVS